MPCLSFFTFASLFGISDWVDKILLRAQMTIVHNWFDTQRNATLETFVPCFHSMYFSQISEPDDAIFSLRIPPGPPTIDFVETAHTNDSGFSSQLLLDIHRLIACWTVGNAECNKTALPNSARKFLKDATSSTSYSSRACLAVRQSNVLKRLWQNAVEQGKNVLDSALLCKEAEKHLQLIGGIFGEASAGPKEELPQVQSDELLEAFEKVASTFKCEAEDLKGVGTTDAVALSEKLFKAVQDLESHITDRGSKDMEALSAWLAGLWTPKQKQSIELLLMRIFALIDNDMMFQFLDPLAQ